MEMSRDRQMNMVPAVVVIPALNPGKAFPAYVRSLLESGIFYVVIVDDGSNLDSAPIFAELEGLDGCILLRHTRNGGKGRALKTAFSYILSRSDWEGTSVITADADGQHILEDVMAVARATAEETDRLVMGKRNLRLSNVPFRSKIGNCLTSAAFHLLYGIRLEDTQTGLRGIPWSLLHWCCQIGGDRFEYEMNVLIRAARDSIGLRQVAIQAVYYDNNRGTHLRAVRDSWRVFCILIAGLGVYALCSVASAATDVLVFWLGSSVLFTFLPSAVCYWWSTVVARTLSSIVDYTLNHAYFTSKRVRGAVVRYYTLWFCQLLCSYLLLMMMQALVPSLPAVISKALMDICLAVGSYQIQLHWVFREKTTSQEKTGQKRTDRERADHEAG